jgi:hypothetical protein
MILQKNYEKNFFLFWKRKNSICKYFYSNSLSRFNFSEEHTEIARLIREGLIKFEDKIIISEKIF